MYSGEFSLPVNIHDEIRVLLVYINYYRFVEIAWHKITLVYQNTGTRKGIQMNDWVWRKYWILVWKTSLIKNRSWSKYFDLTTFNLTYWHSPLITKILLIILSNCFLSVDAGFIDKLQRCCEGIDSRNNLKIRDISNDTSVDDFLPSRICQKVFGDEIEGPM